MSGAVGAGVLVEIVMEGAPVLILIGDVAVDDEACGSAWTPIYAPNAHNVVSRRILMSILIKWACVRSVGLPQKSNDQVSGS